MNLNLKDESDFVNVDNVTSAEKVKIGLVNKNYSCLENFFFNSHTTL